MSQVTVSSVVVILGIVLINQVGQAKGQTVSVDQLMGIWYAVSATYFITALIGSIFSNFWFVRKVQKASAFGAAKTKGKK
jgi:hypothetical protein